MEKSSMLADNPMVALIALAFGKRPSRLEIVGVLISFGGVMLLMAIQRQPRARTSAA